MVWYDQPATKGKGGFLQILVFFLSNHYKGPFFCLHTLKHFHLLFAHISPPATLHNITLNLYKWNEIVFYGKCVTFCNYWLTVLSNERALPSSREKSVTKVRGDKYFNGSLLCHSPFHFPFSSCAHKCHAPRSLATIVTVT